MKVFDTLKPFGEATTVLHEGFEFHARIMEDEDPGLSWLGEFSKTCAQPATFSFEHEPHNNRTFAWFNASNVETREQAKQNYHRAASFGESWSMVGVVVHVSKKGVKLATASLYGIESDSDENYFVEVANDLCSDALADAKAKILELKE